MKTCITDKDERKNIIVQKFATLPPDTQTYAFLQGSSINGLFLNLRLGLIIFVENHIKIRVLLILYFLFVLCLFLNNQII